MFVWISNEPVLVAQILGLVWISKIVGLFLTWTLMGLTTEQESLVQILTVINWEESDTKIGFAQFEQLKFSDGLHS